MRNRHVDVNGSKVRFKFQGKSGKQHTIDLNDRRLAKIVKRCLDLPGYELFRYVDEESVLHSVDASDVNEYLRTITDQQFTAKDFRTWAGSVLACSVLREFEAFETQRQAKKNVVQAIASVAERLGNTPAVCRKCYVHPEVLECYLCGAMMKTFEKQAKSGSSKSPPKSQPKSEHGLRQEELDLLHLLTHAHTERVKAA
jgi:DNA topoisomerase-1